MFREIRLAALKDAPSAFGSTYEREIGSPESRWRQTVVDRARFVADVRGRRAGTVSGGDGDVPGVAALTSMWVDPAFCRAGVGDALVRHVLEWARASGYRSMNLWVVDGNDVARRLYERNGFVPTGGRQEVRAGELESEMRREL